MHSIDTYNQLIINMLSHISAFGTESEFLILASVEQIEFSSAEIAENKSQEIVKLAKF